MNTPTKFVVTAYIGVPDTDPGAKRIVEAGGSLHMGPDDIPNVGRFAMLAAPGGDAKRETQ